MYNSIEIAERIKQIARSQGVTVKNMLNETGLSVNTLQHMKTSMPKTDTLALIADYLGVSVDYLIGRTEEDMRREIREQIIKSTPNVNVRDAVIGKINTMSDDQCRKLLDLLEAMARG